MTEPETGQDDVRPDLTADAAGMQGIELLLSDPSPALRYRVLTELMGVATDDPEVRDVERQRVSAPPHTVAARRDDPTALAWILCMWAHHGMRRERAEVATIAERLFGLQDDDGSFSLRLFRRGRKGGVYSMAPLQAALPLRGLAAAGYATDPRAERAYDWLVGHQLDDGSWPVGSAHGQPGYIAGYRKLPGSKGCRATTQGALACLVLHPQRSRAAQTRNGLDLLLQRETREEWALGTEVSRLTGRVPPAGFFTFYARFDLAFVLDIAARAGASLQDTRVASLVEFLADKRGPFGLWEHPAHPELSRWLTFDILRSLRLLGSGDWHGVAPRVPFRAYPAQRRRF